MLLTNGLSGDAMSSESHDSTSPRGMMLRIRRGKTGYPLRPIDVQPFLIGSGEQCQLRLGGDMPPVHSAIHLDGDSAGIECLASAPELRVNGSVCMAAQLLSGSAIEIGAFLLEYVELPAPVEEPAPIMQQHMELPAAAVTEAVPVADELMDDPKDLSVHGLVDRLEAALERLESIESRRRDGMAGLIERMLEMASESQHRDGHRKSA